jgi:acyl carrier protein
VDEQIRPAVIDAFDTVWRDFGEGDPPAWDDDLVLLESGLDSLAFAVVVTELEDRLGFDPFSESAEPYYPQTVGDMVAYYERFAAAR